ncbi:MAG TPA: response regulator [Polyangiaceae bacterium]|nr:response regulator [Polyangiaceae bacterium]
MLADHVSSKSGEAPNGGACVLVVDDEADIRETLREAVEMVGCTAVLAANGADALKLLRESTPCLMILDLIMPVMTGEELLEIVRQQPAFAHVPVLISTSAPQRAPAGVPLLPKPIDLGAFWAWIRENCCCSARG